MNNLFLEALLDKIVVTLLNVIPLTASNQQSIKSKLNTLLSEWLKAQQNTRFQLKSQDQLIQDLKAHMGPKSRAQEKDDDKLVIESFKQNLCKLQVNQEGKDQSTVTKNKEQYWSSSIESSDLNTKIGEQQARLEESQKQRRDDKEKYRLQYELLKQKGQDKIHRLKDMILEYQTNLQTLQLEISSLKDLLVNEQELKIKLQDKYDEELRKQNEKFELQQKRKEMELKREMLDIQKDLSDKIETMKVLLYNNYKQTRVSRPSSVILNNFILILPIVYQSAKYLSESRQSFSTGLLERMNQLINEKGEMEEVITKQSKMIEMMSQEQELAFQHYEILLKSSSSIDHQKRKLRDSCKIVLQMLGQVRDMRDSLQSYIQEFGGLLYNQNLEKRPRVMASNFEIATNDSQNRISINQSINQSIKQRLLSFDDQYREQQQILNSKKSVVQLKTDPKYLDNRRYSYVKHSLTQSTVPSPKRYSLLTKNGFTKLYSSFRWKQNQSKGQQ